MCMDVRSYMHQLSPGLCTADPGTNLSPLAVSGREGREKYLSNLQTEARVNYDLFPDRTMELFTASLGVKGKL